MNKGLFDLTNFESMGDNDIISMNINESTEQVIDEAKEYDGPKVKHEDYKKMSKEEKEEFAKNIKDHLEKNGKSHNESVIAEILEAVFNEGAAEFDNKTPDVNHPEVPFETNGASGHNTPVPANATHKNYDDASVTIPEGTSETPKAKPYDASSVSVPTKVTLTADVYNNALSALKKSFKESVDIIEMLENAEVINKSIEEQQEEYIESVIGDQLLAAYENGPIFEAVKRGDKDAVKDIVRSLRSKIKDDLHDAKVKFYKPNLVARALAGLVLPLEANASIQQIWQTRLWQVLGVCLVEAGNIKDVADNLTKKYESELGEYKILYAAAYPTLADLFRVKFNWKNSKGCYFLMVDKKLPKELTEFQKDVKQAIEEKENDEKSDD